jgi:hypothetical protein
LPRRVPYLWLAYDDDDREEALRQMKRALVGLNLIESIPFVGAAVETALAHIEGEKKRGGVDDRGGEED